MTDLPRLVDPITDLDVFSGAPFSQEQTDVAEAAVRAAAGWHIAPVVTETLTIESDGGPMLFVPTMQLRAVTAVRDATSGSPGTTLAWASHPTPRFRAGILYRPQGWPAGFLEVDVQHGYDRCPRDLLPVIAGRIRSLDSGSGSVRLGSLSTTSASPDQGRLKQAVERYRIPGFA